MDTRLHWPALLRAAREGSRNALGALLEAHRPLLLLLARESLSRRLQVKHSPADLAQDTFADAVASFPDFRGNTLREFRRWLRQIFEHNRVDLIRHYGRRGKRNLAGERSLGDDPNLTVDVRPGPVEEAVRHERLDLLDRAGARLSAAERELVRLHVQEGLPLVELSHRLDCSDPALRERWLRLLAHWQDEVRVLGRQEAVPHTHKNAAALPTGRAAAERQAGTRSLVS